MLLSVLSFIIIFSVGCQQESLSEIAEEKIEKSIEVNGGIVGNVKTQGIEISVPRNALEGTQGFIVESKTDYERPSKDSGELTSHPVEIQLNQEIKRLYKPIEVKMKLNAQELSHLSEDGELFVSYFNGQQWEYIKAKNINLDEGSLSFETYHLSLFSKAIPTKEEQMESFAKKKALEQWQQKNTNGPTNEQTQIMIKKILNEKLGITDKSLEQDVAEAVLKEFTGTKLLIDYKDGKLDDFTQDLAVTTGKKLFEVIEDLPATQASGLLDQVTNNASKIGTGVQMVTHIAQGNYEEAAKALSLEILDSYPLTKMFKVAVDITDRQINRWKDQEIEAAYQVFKNGVESDVPFWGYNVEQGNFEELWVQMRGIQTKIINDAKKDYAAKMGVTIDDIGPKVLENIEVQAKAQLKEDFMNRQKDEAEIESIKEENLKLLGFYKDAKLLEKYRYGYTADTSFEFRLERLFRIKDMILKDTEARITNIDLPDQKEISFQTIAQLTSLWYNSEDGKEKYREKLIELGYVEDTQESRQLVFSYTSDGKALPTFYQDAPLVLASPISIDEDGQFDFHISGQEFTINNNESYDLNDTAKVKIHDFSFKGQLHPVELTGEGTFSLHYAFEEEKENINREAGEYYEKWEETLTISGKILVDEPYGVYDYSNDYRVVTFYFTGGKQTGIYYYEDTDEDGEIYIAESPYENEVIESALIGIYEVQE